MAGLVIINPKSGSCERLGSEIHDRFAGHTIEAREGSSLEARVHEAAKERWDFVAIAGGDGSMRAAARALRGSHVPLLTIPGGTLNHFARQLGIPTVEAAAEAALAGHTTRVDVGEVNGEPFVNNSSVGFYPWLVRFRDRELSHKPKKVASVQAAWAQVRKGRKLWVTVDGTRHRAWMVWVGNGSYGRNLLDLGERETLQDNVLDVRVLLAGGTFSRIRVVGALLAGRLDQTPLVLTECRSDVRLEFDRPMIPVALDGEVRTLTTPLEYRSVAAAVLVLVPPEREA